MTSRSRTIRPGRSQRRLACSRVASFVRIRSTPFQDQSINENYEARFTGCGVHVPSRIDGGVSVGQYKRITSANFPLGAGSQFASLSLPGESAWTYKSKEPSGFVVKWLR